MPAYENYSPNCEIPLGKELPDGFFRWALAIEYNGSSFHGWQTQTKPNLPTVQEALELVLSEIANESIRVVCAGRTDSGVHATCQVIHFDTKADRLEKAWTMGANTLLPNTIAVRWAKRVPGQFHARFSALSRSYRYIIDNRKTRPALAAGQMTWERRELDEKSMHQAAQALLGEHDFTSYRAIGCQAHSPVRCIESISVKRQDTFIILDVTANAFLQHMIRNITGVLLEIGLGIQPVDWSKKVLDAKDRTRGGVTAPPDGLHFIDVDYPEVFDLPVLRIILY